MNELLETERAYVEELLCVLEVSVRHASPCMLCNRLIINRRTSIQGLLGLRRVDES